MIWLICVAHTWRQLLYCWQQAGVGVLHNLLCVAFDCDCAGVQVRNRWSELSVDEQQKITQLAYQHMKDGECGWTSSATADQLPHVQRTQLTSSGPPFQSPF